MVMTDEAAEHLLEALDCYEAHVALGRMNDRELEVQEELVLWLQRFLARSPRR